MFVRGKNTIARYPEFKQKGATSVDPFLEIMEGIDQNMRSNNLEINGIPERKSLMVLIERISKVVNNPLVAGDVLHAHRVAKHDGDSDRPRTVIVNLRSQRRRDEFLAAVVRYNRTNVHNKLSSRHLGLSGYPVPIYVAEHLTPAVRNIHAATRMTAKENGYKYVWVKEGRVFVRKNDNSSAILIKNLDDLKLLI